MNDKELIITNYYIGGNTMTMNLTSIVDNTFGQTTDTTIMEDLMGNGLSKVQNLEIAIDVLTESIKRGEATINNEKVSKLTTRYLVAHIQRRKKELMQAKADLAIELATV